MIITVIVSPFDHPYYHLSLEEYLLKQEGVKDPVVLFYINRPSVIVGRNQNPWLESNISALKRDQVILGRRLTGGGTVYHDYGNVNYAVVYHHSQYSEEAIFAWLRRGLESLGVAIQVGQRKELLMGGAKISGTAFGRYKDRVIHHGTLLVSTDLNALRAYLEINQKITSTRSVRSVPSHVANIGSSYPGIDNHGVIRLLERAIEEPHIRLSKNSLDTILQSQGYLKLIDKYQSWSWLYGETPTFYVRDPVNNEQLIHVQHGKIERNTDAVEKAIAQILPDIRLQHTIKLKEVTHADRVV